jgi:hypothetical protein
MAGIAEDPGACTNRQNVANVLSDFFNAMAEFRLCVADTKRGAAHVVMSAFERTSIRLSAAMLPTQSLS